MGQQLSDTQQALDTANKRADLAETSLANTCMELEALQDKLCTIDDDGVYSVMNMDCVSFSMTSLCPMSSSRFLEPRTLGPGNLTATQGFSLLGPTLNLAYYYNILLNLCYLFRATGDCNGAKCFL